MRDYDQLQLDVTLSHEKAIKENVTTTVEFVYKQNLAKGVEEIKNKHEGYGIAAENHAKLSSNVKNINTDMGNMLKLLPNDSGEFVNATTSLFNSAVETAMAAINLAAESKRIIDDLIYTNTDETPIENMINETDEFEEIEED